LLQEREGEDEVDVEDGELPPDQDLSASEKKMLLRIRNRNRLTKAERSSMRRLKRRKERQRREEERELLQARYTRHRSAYGSESCQALVRLRVFSLQSYARYRSDIQGQKHTDFLDT
jgi:hypothetical protein